MRSDVAALYIDPKGPYPHLVSEWCALEVAMSYTIAIDPGKHIGWALGSDNIVHGRGTITDLNCLPWFGVGLAIIEMPRVYPSVSKWRGDPQHIVRLAFLAGRIAAQYPRYVLYEPRAWRGNAPDATIVERTRRSLRAGEPLGDSDHSWDAIGLLLYHWGRF